MNLFPWLNIIGDVVTLPTASACTSRRELPGVLVAEALQFGGQIGCQGR